MMAKHRYLLDTNILMWLSSDLKRLPASLLDALEAPEARLYVSSASFWELSIKQSIGKIDIGLNFEQVVERHTIREIPVTSRYTKALWQLPMHHADPFDRMILAQAITEGLILATSDRRLSRYPVEVLQA